MVDARIRYRTSREDSARWQGFRFRPDDIVISTPAKAGTTWMHMICALVVFQTADLPAPLSTLSPWLDLRLRPVWEVHDQLENQRHRRFIKTHTPLDGLPIDPRVTYVVVGRDPRDMAVLLHYQRANVKLNIFRRHETKHVPATPDVRETMLTWMNCDDTPQNNLVTLRGVVWHLADAWSRRRSPNVVLFHYSDLSRDLGAEMRRLAARLGITIPEQTWPALVESATFERMRQRSDDLAPDVPLGIINDSGEFFRSGSSGNGATGSPMRT